MFINLFIYHSEISIYFPRSSSYLMVFFVFKITNEIVFKELYENKLFYEAQIFCILGWICCLKEKKRVSLLNKTFFYSNRLKFATTLVRRNKMDNLRVELSTSKFILTYIPPHWMAEFYMAIKFVIRNL